LYSVQIPLSIISPSKWGSAYRSTSPKPREELRDGRAREASDYLKCLA
jgi:hypothetical protein